MHTTQEAPTSLNKMEGGVVHIKNKRELDISCFFYTIELSKNKI